MLTFVWRDACDVHHTPAPLLRGYSWRSLIADTPVDKVTVCVLPPPPL